LVELIIIFSIHITHPMADLKKTLLYILSVVGAAISYIPAALYAYVYSEYFTKYIFLY